MSPAQRSAWQVREEQRERLLVGLMSTACVRADESSFAATFFNDLMKKIVTGLNYWGGEFDIADEEPSAVETLYSEIQEQIRIFTRSDSEYFALLARFFEKYLVPAAMREFHGALLREIS